MYDATFPVAPRTGDEKSLEVLIKRHPHVERYNLAPEDIQAMYLQVEKGLSHAIPEPVKERLLLAATLATYGYFQWQFFTVANFWTLTVIEQALGFKFDEMIPAPHTLVRSKKAKGTAERIEHQPLHRLERLLRQGWRIKGLPTFNGSFRSLMQWAVDTKLIHVDTQIHMQDIRNVYFHRFLYNTFPDLAEDEGITLPDNPTTDDIHKLWASLPQADQRRLYPTNAMILAEMIPTLRNELAHPGRHNLVQLGRSQVESFIQASDLLGQLWPNGKVVDRSREVTPPPP